MTYQDSSPPLTVIIPTYNRAPILRRALAGYLEQSSTHVISELLVVDDGSTDDTRFVVEEVAKTAPFTVRYLYQPNRGPAAARNLGLSEANTWLILYTDDDVTPHSNLVEEHVEWHRKNPIPTVSVLGFVTWSPEIRPTPFMRWYGEAGPLFAYKHFRDQREIDYRYFYTCNLSVKRDFLLAYGKFDEHFTIAAYEDVELGYRLNKAGLNLLYNARAVGYHYQFFTFADACLKRKRTESARRTFLQTEAGRHFLKLDRQRAASLTFRTCTFIATLFARSVPPSASVLDSRLPLPGVIYRSLLKYYGEQMSENLWGRRGQRLGE